jgi:hypothetical protein
VVAKKINESKEEKKFHLADFPRKKCSLSYDAKKYSLSYEIKH